MNSAPVFQTKCDIDMIEGTSDSYICSFRPPLSMNFSIALYLIYFIFELWSLYFSKQIAYFSSKGKKSFWKNPKMSNASPLRRSSGLMT
jgi:hypothetical protein